MMKLENMSVDRMTVYNLEEKFEPRIRQVAMPFYYGEDNLGFYEDDENEIISIDIIIPSYIIREFYDKIINPIYSFINTMKRLIFRV